MVIIIYFNMNLDENVIFKVVGFQLSASIIILNHGDLFTLF
jgi:hypothetical protein